MCCNFFLSAGVQVLRSECISSSVLIMVKSVLKSVLLSSDEVIHEAIGTVAITILDKKDFILNGSYIK